MTKHQDLLSEVKDLLREQGMIEESADIGAADAYALLDELVEELQKEAPPWEGEDTWNP